MYALNVFKVQITPMMSQSKGSSDQKINMILFPTYLDLPTYLSF